MGFSFQLSGDCGVQCLLVTAERVDQILAELMLHDPALPVRHSKLSRAPRRKSAPHPA
jgi:hypothetical protein